MLVVVAQAVVLVRVRVRVRVRVKVHAARGGDVTDGRVVNKGRAEQREGVLLVSRAIVSTTYSHSQYGNSK